MLSVVSKYTRLVSVVIRTNKNVGFVSVARRNMSMYFFDDEIKLSAPVTFDRSNREVSQIDTTDIDSTMMNDIDEFGDNCELMGSNEHHGFRWEHMKPKDWRSEKKARSRGKDANYKVWSLVQYIQLKRQHGYNMRGK